MSHTHAGAAWHRILVPHDFSSCSERALRLAAEVATQDATLILAHVAELPENLAASDILGSYGDGGESVADYVRTHAKAHLARAVAASGWAGPVEHAVLVGPVDDAILRAAQDLRADLVVMGTHGRSGFAHWLHGSVTESVIRRSVVPVLSVRVPDARTPDDLSRPRLEDELSG